MTPTETETETKVALLKIDHATVHRSGVNILDDVCFEIPQGQHTAIIGPNGSGKSTLMKVITRHLYPSAPANGAPPVTIFGNSVWNIFELRNLLGIVSPELQASFINAGGLTGMQSVLSGFFSTQGTSDRQKITAQMIDEAADALKIMGATELADKRMEIMSAGEARRVLIARALVHHPRALLLDEPTTGLDIAGRRQFLETLRTLCAQGVTLLLVTHHIDEVIPEIERVVLMRKGRVFADGAKNAVLNSDNLSSLFGLKVNLQESGSGYYSADLAE